MSSEVPHGTITCDDGAFFMDCPVCGERVRLRKDVRQATVRTTRGDARTEHTDVDVEPYLKHYRAEHG